jgi:S1-C subfamily serine protease
MEDLNKNQIVLLTLLVSFVTSIATGIITTTLLNEAPVEVTRTINRIVERTVETVTPANVLSGTKTNQVTTIVVNEDDSITSSINKNAKSLVRIYEKDGSTLLTSFYGIGLVVTKDGLISADRKYIPPLSLYTGAMSDGTEVKLVPLGVDKKTNFILFKANLPEKTTYPFAPVSLADSEPKLGQTLISLGGETENAVSVGRVTSLDIKESGMGTSTVKYLASIVTDVATKDLVGGTPVLNLSGEVAGIKLGNNELRVFTPISVLKKELASLVETPKAQ